MDEHPAWDVVPMKRPGVLGRDRVGKQRAVGIQLQIGVQSDRDEGRGPQHADRHRKIAKRMAVRALCVPDVSDIGRPGARK
jgi:hypothetical protein